MKIAVLVNGLSVDQVHHKEWQAFIGGAAIQETGDVGMFQVRQNLTFILETVEDEPRVEVRLYQFDGDLFSILVVRANRPIDRSHAALSQLFEEAIVGDHFSGHSRN